MLQRKTMGWRDRDYAKWTDEERRRFYGSGATSVGSSAKLFPGDERSPRATRSRVFRRGIGPAILVSGLLFAAGHFPVGHPIVPFLHFTIRGPHPTGTINTPSTATVGSTLTFNGSAPSGNGPVTVEGSYDGGQTWQTLSSVDSVDGSYTAQITLTQRGTLQLRIVFADGSRAVGSVPVV